MSQDFGTRPSITVRPPATANLMIDSQDRSATFNTPWDFQITKRESIMNGFFNRIATTEVVLDWCDPNISSELENNTLIFDLSGTGANTFAGIETITLPPGLYTVETLIDEIIGELNAIAGTGMTFTAAQFTNKQVYFDVSGGVITNISPNKLAEQLDLQPSGGAGEYVVENCADIRPYRYIDFISTDLTYAQYLKDSSTQKQPRDVLCRWYFSEDGQEDVDGYGYPIFQGYRAFCRRRIFNPPKYIRWDNNLPIGNLRFQVVDDQGNFLADSATSTSSWLMTLQVSEN